MKKFLTTFIAILLLFTLLITGYCPVYAYEIHTGNETVNDTKAGDKTNFTNLVVFARFSDEDEFIDDVYAGQTVRKITDNSYNAATYNVADYYKNASGDKLRMQSVYLMDNGGSLQLSQERGYYASYSETNPNGYKTSQEKAMRIYDLRIDWTDAVNKAIAEHNPITNYDGTVTYNYSDLDKNGDGMIDAITVIYKNTTQDISVEWSSPLWNYQDFANYIEINTENGKKLSSQYYVQLTNTYDHLYKDAAGKPVVSLKAPIHEMGHIMGLKDLYNSSMTSPIYYMSAMSNAISPVPQEISIKEKEALGWVDGENLRIISSNGSYTLKMNGTRESNSVVGYKMEIPNEDKTLYFEYRNFSDEGDKYDSQSKNIMDSEGKIVDGINLKSGLVCYLAKGVAKFPNNMGCTAANWKYQVLGGSQGTKSDAAIGPGEVLQLTNQTRVKVTEMQGDTLTFQIEGVYEQPHTHTGGRATCTKKAVCESCGEEYGEVDASNHINTELRGKKDATYEEEGYTGDLYCMDCEKCLEKGKVVEKLSKDPTPDPTPNPTPTPTPDPTPTPNPTPTPDPTPTPTPSPDLTPKPSPQPSKNQTSKIKYVLKGGKNHKKNPKVYATASGVKVYNPTKKGYQFKGWYTDKNYKTKLSKNRIQKGTGDVTLYARWKKNTYKIKYQLNKGTNHKKNPVKYSVTTKTIKLKNPTRAGYTFKGWYADKKMKKKVAVIKRGSVGNKRLYAKWKKNVSQ